MPLTVRAFVEGILASHASKISPKNNAKLSVMGDPVYFDFCQKKGFEAFVQYLLHQKLMHSYLPVNPHHIIKSLNHNEQLQQDQVLSNDKQVQYKLSEYQFLTLCKLMSTRAEYELLDIFQIFGMFHYKF